MTGTDTADSERAEIQRYGSTQESLLDRRDRLAESEGNAYGSIRLFRAVPEYIFETIKAGDTVLEVDAAAGLFTRLLLARRARVTVIEPSWSFRELLKPLHVEHPGADELIVRAGFTSDLPADARFDHAVVSFSARRGRGLLSQVHELLPHVDGTIFLILADDGSLDWAHLVRAAAQEGLTVDARYLVDIPTLRAAVENDDRMDLAELHRAIVITVDASACDRPLTTHSSWNMVARAIPVPWPAPRGVATRLIRYFIAGGDRAVLITTDKAGINRLYGNLRTAAHRNARDEITVRMIDAGIQLMRIPQVGE
ncbi:MAG: hypothetical protein LBS17_04410 [Actinomycetes bacterium]|jgi:hypothetical protein|nr:hypothetical protein [Actinomycetes bacterium]